MDTLSFKTKSANKDTVQKAWLLIDAEGQILGRVASEIARLLRGKHKAYFTPHVDCGDYVVVVNAEKVVLTGNKITDKEYARYSGYPGGQRSRSFQEALKKRPEFILEHAVKGMLPKNKLGSEMFRNLHVYAGPDHKHEAQKPQEYKLT